MMHKLSLIELVKVCEEHWWVPHIHPPHHCIAAT